MAELIKVVQQVLVRGILCSKLNRAYRLTFITVFGIRVVVACLPTLAPVGVVNEFQLLQAFFY